MCQKIIDDYSLYFLNDFATLVATDKSKRLVAIKSYNFSP